MGDRSHREAPLTPGVGPRQCAREGKAGTATVAQASSTGLPRPAGGLGRRAGAARARCAALARRLGSVQAYRQCAGTRQQGHTAETRLATLASVESHRQ